MQPLKDLLQRKVGKKLPKYKFQDLAMEMAKYWNITPKHREWSSLFKLAKDYQKAYMNFKECQDRGKDIYYFFKLMNL